MGVATHLGIDLAEYDARIRTFIPDYEEMLDVAAAAVPSDARTIVDLGTGTGALAARCLAAAPRARVVGIDSDPQIIQLAAQRLGPRATLITGSFLDAPLPACDVVVSSLALHHVRARARKATLYRRIRAALAAGGRAIIVDCQPAADPTLARRQHAAWNAHLRTTYSQPEARQLFAAWAREDFYVPLEAEMELIEGAGLAVEVLWRKGVFAVVTGVRRRAGRGRGVLATRPRRARRGN